MLKIPLNSELIESSSIIGYDEHDNPIFMVVTRGGLYSFFLQKANHIENIASAPHKAIGLWLLQKKLKYINFDKANPSYTKIDNLNRRIVKSLTKFENIPFGGLIKNREYNELNSLLKSIYNLPPLSVHSDNKIRNNLEDLKAINKFNDWYILTDLEHTYFKLLNKSQIIQDLKRGIINKFMLIKSIHNLTYPKLIASMREFYGQ